MNTTLGVLLGKRMWMIPGVVVWDELAAFEPEFIVTEADGGAKRLLHVRCSIGGNPQTINFGDLTDQRGNKLPSMLTNPTVVPLARSGAGAVVQGSVSTDSFRIAQVAASNQPAVVDLLVIEMG